MNSIITLLITSGILVTLLTGCWWSPNKKESILVIAVDSLGVDQISCSNDFNKNSSNEANALYSGFQILCSESIRFTHAYTPSVMAQPSIMSIMTALYPKDHLIRDNSSLNSIDGSIKTAAEKAVEQGYRTVFISGGPPLWSFSGLNHGFEKFIDPVNININRLYKPVEEVFQRFLKELKNAPDKNFFSTLYLADLQFPQSETLTDLEEIRSLSKESQLQEIDESLFFLINQLKKSKKWDNTHLFLVGLNSNHKTKRKNELRGNSVFNNETHVALFIKPARTKRDLGIRWKIDRNVSLVDVGVTLFDILGKKITSDQFKTVSLKKIFSKEPTAYWSSDRPILIESSWPAWRAFSNTRFALRKGHWLFVNDKKIEKFNSFIDKTESLPAEYSQKTDHHMQNLFIQHKLPPWDGINKDFNNKWHLGSELYTQGIENVSPEIYLALQGFLETTPWDEDVFGWLLEIESKKENWIELEKISKNIYEKKWLNIISQLNRSNIPISNKISDHCMGLIINKSNLNRPLNISYRNCSNDLLLDFLKWFSHLENSSIEIKLRRKFLKKYISHRMDRLIYRENIRNQLFWNVNNRFNNNLAMVELILKLPKFRKVKKVLERELRVVKKQTL